MVVAPVPGAAHQVEQALAGLLLRRGREGRRAGVMHVGRRVRDAGCRCQPVERGMMPGMDGVRRGTRTRRLDEAAARATNGASHDDGPAAPPEDVDRAAFPDLATRRRSTAARRARSSARSSTPAVRSAPTARWARCSSRTACSSAIRPRSGTSPTRTSSAGSSAPTSTRARRSCSPTRSAGTGRA